MIHLWAFRVLSRTKCEYKCTKYCVIGGDEVLNIVICHIPYTISNRLEVMFENISCFVISVSSSVSEFFLDFSSENVRKRMELKSRIKALRIIGKSYR